FFGEALGEGSGVDFFFGDGDGESLGEGVGDGFFLVDAFRFFGGGVGSKICLIFVPRSCWPTARRTAPPVSSAHAIRIGSARLFAREINERVPAAPPCSIESRRRSFPAGSS